MDPDTAQGHSASDCFRCQRPMPAPAEGQQVAAGWALDADGDVAYCPEHVPGPPFGWRDWVTVYTKADMEAVKVDPAKVPEKYRHLFER